MVVSREKTLAARRFGTGAGKASLAALWFAACLLPAAAGAQDADAPTIDVSKIDPADIDTTKPPGDSDEKYGGLPQLKIERPLTPLGKERLDQMVPKHPGYLGALAPENIAKPRPKPPFDLTGTWFVDLSQGFNKFMFGPPYPNFYEPGRRSLIEAREAEANGKTYHDAIGQCYPPGMPMILTRVWPHAFIQLPTAIYMISGFNNSVRTIFLDGREPSDPNIVVPGYNGESIGKWQGNALVVTTKYMEPDHHYIDRGIPISDQFQIVERITLVDNGTRMHVDYVMTDPDMWEGEWKATEDYTRQDHTDINEANCILEYNQNLPGTDLGSETAEERGKSEIKGVNP